MTVAQYVEKYLSMHESLKNELTFDADSNATTEDITFEFAGIITIRAGDEASMSYRQG